MGIKLILMGIKLIFMVLKWRYKLIFKGCFLKICRPIVLEIYMNRIILYISFKNAMF